MKDFSQINWSKSSEDDILDYMEKLDESKKFDFVKHLCEHHSQIDFEWIYSFEDLSEYLLKNNRAEDLLWFIEWFDNSFPGEYLNNYQFLERELINFYMSKGDWESVSKRISVIEQNPVHGIDVVTIRLMYQLIYHGKYEMAVEYCKNVIDPIAESDQLYFNPEHIFIVTVYMHKLQNIYEEILAGKVIDEEKLVTELVELGIDEVNLRNVFQLLREDFDKEKIDLCKRKFDSEKYLIMNIEFFKYMYKTHNVPFMLSEILISFVANKELYNKKKTTSVCYFGAKKIDKHIVSKYDNMYGTNNLEISGKVWGLIYVFEFFHHYGLITDEEFEKSSDAYLYFRNTMMKIEASDLWQYDFVLKWPDVFVHEKDSDLPEIFHKTKFTEDQTSRGIVKDFLTDYETPYWLIKELNV